jgi:hypothetical protein
MAIDRIPGVGPQNTDIATAVAAAVPTIAAITSSITTNAASAGLTNASITSAGNAAGWGATGPTTTQIAAAVPTLAQITSAVTTNAASAGVTVAAITSAGNSAGWGATGPTTTQIAAAVPTLAQINTSVATNAPSPWAWTYISALTGSNPSGVTFSGLSGYRTYKLYGSFSTNNAGWPMVIELNGTAGVGMSQYGYSLNTSSVWNPYEANLVGRISPWPALNGSGPHQVEFTVGNGSLAAPGWFNVKAYMRGSSTTAYWNVDGFRVGNGPITSIRVYDPNNVQSISGTFYLFGAN